MILIAEGITGGGVLQADGRRDIARVDLFDLFAVIGVHLKDAAEALALALGGVENVGAGFTGTGVHAEERQLTDEGIRHDLEGQRRKGLFIRRGTAGLLIRAGHRTLDRGNVDRRGHVVNDGVQQLLHALVAVRSTAQDGNELIGDGALADSGLDLVDRQLTAVEVLFHQIVIQLGDLLHQLRTIHLDLFGHILGDGLVLHVGAQIVSVDVGLVLNKVHQADEIGLIADGQLDRHRVAVQTIVHHVQDIVEVRTHDVHLVDIGHARNAVVVRLMPDGFRLRLNAALCAEHADSAVQHAQGTLNFNRKVDVPGSVDDVDTLALPVAGGSSGRDGDAALLLLSHPVHGRRAVVRFTDLAVHTRVEQDALRGGRLTGVDMRHDTDVSGIFQRILSVRHSRISSFRLSLSCPAIECKAVKIFRHRLLPTIVRERLVGLSHLVHVFLALDSSAGVVGCIDDLVAKTLCLGLLAALAGELDQPTQRQGLTALRADLDRDLVSRTANAASLDFQHGHDVVHGRFKNFGRFLAGLFGDSGEGFVANLLRGAALAVIHDLIDQLGNDGAAVDRVGQHFTLRYKTTSGHGIPS